MIPREISGPQAQYERHAGQSFRDVRPVTKRLAETLGSAFSGIVLLGTAAASFAFPALIDLTVPGSILYATWVMARRVKLPLRLPRSAEQLDWNYPSPVDRKPRMAAGSIYLGIDQVTGQELWITNEDGRQHGTIPGTTGAGKSTAILSLLANALSHGSGFVLVDGKADNALHGQVLALARHFGREDDVLVLNFLVASGDKDSHSFNPFAMGNADAIRELLASQLGEQRSEDSNGVFRARAVALIGTIAPVLVWMRDQKGVPISIESIRFALELRSIWTLATHKIFLHRQAVDGEVKEIAVPVMPEDILYPLRAYLGELPGYDTSLPYNEQKGDEPSKQHGFALFYFTATFTQLSVSLGHIFKPMSGDIDMRDVVLNRRILLVNLPAMENSDATLAALGKIVVASLRGMLAQLLGARLEGTAREIFALKPGVGEGPFQVVFDEVAYYATEGMDRMLAMGRGLNIMFWVAFQEISGLWARLGEKTASLLGNANLTLAMRLQDAHRTREWLEKTAGEVEVTQATSFLAGEAGNYRESHAAEVRKVPRVAWSDLQKLLEGEAIVLFGGRRIYAKLFYASVDATTGPFRRSRPLRLPAPVREDAPQGALDVAEVVARLEGGAVLRDVGRVARRADPVLQAFTEGVQASAASKPVERITEGLLAAARAPLPARVDDELAEPPVTSCTPMIEATIRDAGSALDVADDRTTTGRSRDRIATDAALQARLTTLETEAGAEPRVAERAAREVAEVVAEAGMVALPEPPPMLPADLAARLQWLRARLHQ
jgi:intracellular multiplication protein IcmO